MTWIAIPFGAFTVLSTMAGGLLGLRLAHSLPTVIALTGGVVVAGGLFDVLPESLDALDDPELVAKATRFAALVAAKTCERPGAAPPRLDELG